LNFSYTLTDAKDGKAQRTTLDYLAVVLPAKIWFLHSINALFIRRLQN
jgi:hypothetical protein